MNNKLQTYNQLPENLKLLYSSDATVKMQSRIINKYSLVEEKEYLDIVGETILGFHRTSELPELLQEKVGVSVGDSYQIVADLAEFLEPVIAREKSAKNQAIVQELQQKITPPPREARLQIPTENIQEVEMNKIPEPQVPTPPVATKPIRTMEEDMKKEDRFQIPTEIVPEVEIEKIPEPKAPILPVVTKPIRTMEEDMSHVHGYGAYRAQFPEETKGAEHMAEVIRSASQEDLLAKKPRLAGMPTYEERQG